MKKVMTFLAAATLLCACGNAPKQAEATEAATDTVAACCGDSTCAGCCADSAKVAEQPAEVK